MNIPDNTYRKTAGVYKIENETTGYTYIGKTLICLCSRITSHRNQLLCYEHANFSMQYDCIITGISAFKSTIIEVFHRNPDKIKNRIAADLQLQILELEHILIFIKNKLPVYNNIKGLENGRTYNSTLKNFVEYGKKMWSVRDALMAGDYIEMFGEMTINRKRILEEIPIRGFTPDDLPVMFEAVKIKEYLEKIEQEKLALLWKKMKEKERKT